MVTLYYIQPYQMFLSLPSLRLRAYDRSLPQPYTPKHSHSCNIVYFKEQLGSCNLLVNTYNVAQKHLDIISYHLCGVTRENLLKSYNFEQFLNKPLERSVCCICVECVIRESHLSSLAVPCWSMEHQLHLSHLQPHPVIFKTYKTSLTLSAFPVK